MGLSEGLGDGSGAFLPGRATTSPVGDSGLGVGSIVSGGVVVGNNVGKPDGTMLGSNEGNSDGAMLGSSVGSQTTRIEHVPLSNSTRMSISGQKKGSSGGGANVVNSNSPLLL